MSGPFGSSQWMYNAGGDFYGTTIDNSLRFNDNDSSHLTRTPSSTGNQKTWTFSAWVKRGNLGITAHIFNPTRGGDGTNETSFRFLSDDRFDVYDSGTTRGRLITTRKFRDVGSWYHIVFVLDTTNATSTDRMKLYINGERVTAFDTYSAPSQNTDWGWNATREHSIGSYNYGADSQFFDGYIAEVNHVDGTALDASSFGETKSGVWIPKEYSGSYGTNGFHLEFAGNANDTSGNGNNWTANNINSHDYMIDTPTNNFCVMNSSYNIWYKNISQGNLRVQGIGSVTAPYGATHVGTMGIQTGKWYWEYRLNTHNNGNTAGFIRNGNLASDGSYPRDMSLDRIFGINNWDNAIYVGSSAISKSFSVNGTAGDIMAITYDADNNTFSLYKNGSFVGTSATNSLSLNSNEHALPMMSVAFYDNQMHMNFGQDSTFAGATTAGGNTDENGYGDFKYTPPSGYLALCSANLPAPAIDPAADETPEDYFNTVLWTGNNTNNRAITGVGFQPDLVVAKSRPANSGFNWVDAVRGGTKNIRTSDNTVEQTVNTVISFQSDGFTVGDGNGYDINKSGEATVGWSWLAGNGTTSNTDGSITSTVSVNTDAGFSIATYTGNATSGATVGHGLGVAPDMVIIKARTRSGGSDWPVYHRGIPNSETGWIRLNLANTWSSTSILWNNTAPSSSVVTLGSYDYVNDSGTSHVMYSFAEKEGYSKFGSYTGNGSSDGSLIYTGFRPAFVLVKSSSNSSPWLIMDNTRDTDNQIQYLLRTNSTGAETTSAECDFLSNGFKYRGASTNSNYYHNVNTATYIYMAFAEQPFKYANAR